jgi:hypothetical protein
MTEFAPGETLAPVPVDAAEYRWKYSAYRLSEYAGTAGAELLEVLGTAAPHPTFGAIAAVVFGIVAPGAETEPDAAGTHPLAGLVGFAPIPEAVPIGTVLA